MTSLSLSRHCFPLSLLLSPLSTKDPTSLTARLRLFSTRANSLRTPPPSTEITSFCLHLARPSPLCSRLQHCRRNKSRFQVQLLHPILFVIYHRHQSSSHNLSTSTLADEATSPSTRALRPTLLMSVKLNSSWV